MANNIDFKITTSAVTRELDRLARTLEGLIGTAKELDNVDVELFDRDETGKINNVVKGMDRVVNILNDTEAATASARGEMNRYSRTARTALGGVSKAILSGERDMETLETAIRNVSKEVSKVTRVSQKMKLFPDDQAKRVKDHENAIKRLTAAQERMQEVNKSGKVTGKEYRKVTADLKAAETQVNRTSKALEKGQEEWDEMARDVVQAQKALERLDGARVHKEFAAAFSPAVNKNIEKLRDSVKSVDSMMDAFGNTMVESVAKSRGMVNVTQKMIAPLNSLRESFAETREENERLIRSLTKDVGNTRSAYSGAEKALLGQQKAYRDIANTMNQVSAANTRLAESENRAAQALSRGNVAARESQKITSALARVRSDLISSYRKMDAQGMNLDTQFDSMKVSLDKYQKSLDAAVEKQKRFKEGSTGFKDSQDDINRLRAAMDKLNEAMDSNRSNYREQQNAIRTINTSLKAQETSLNSVENALRDVKTHSNAWEKIVADIRSATSAARELATAFGAKLISGVRTASNVIGKFGETADSVFARLQSAINAAGGYFKKFGNNVKSGMDKAKSSMLEATASGYALMSIGNQVQMFGNMAFRRMGTGLSEYMGYEEKRIQAAIAATEFDRETGTLTVNNKLLDDIIFDMQRGEEAYLPQWMKDYSGGRPLPVTFSAQELAEGMYFYSAAIGQEITAENAEMLVPTINTIMQMAKVSNTGLESAIKGVMNIAMEFGLDPRAMDAQSQKEIQRITAQTGYLANISTMEVTDIVEMFKMVGPMANLVAGGAPGAGLDDTFMLAFMASEVGLRGGNVGRGVSQLFTSLLDPTDKMLEVMGKYFSEDGSAFSSEDYKAEFFEGGALKGGIMGFFEKLGAEGLKGTDMAQMVAEMFTNNATRAALGPLLAMDGKELSATTIAGIDWDEFFEGWDEDPFKWLAAAAAETANSVSGWFAYMQNAWFQFSRSIIDSIKGPLMGAFRFIGSLLFSFADVINDFPEIGQAIATIVTLIAGIASVGGTALIAAGGLLILSRTLVTMGGVIGIVVRSLAMATLGFLSILPVILLLIAAGAALALAWNKDFLGMRSAWENFKSNFDMDKAIDSIVRGSLTHLMLFGRGFKELFDVVLLGGDSFDHLGTMLTKLLGNQLGGAVLGKILQLRDGFRDLTMGEMGATTGELARLAAGFDDLSPSIGEILDKVDLSKIKFEDLQGAVQGVLEQIFMGQMSGDSIKAIENIGAALGMERGGLTYILQDAAKKMKEFMVTGIAAAAGIVGVWVSGTQSIYGALRGLFSNGTSEVISFGEAFSAVFNGFYTGITTTFTVALQGVTSLINTISSLITSMGEVNTQFTIFGGHVVTLTDLFNALGVAIGIAVGVQFLLRFAPVIAIFTRLIPLVASFAGVLAGLGGRLIAVAAQFAVMALQGAAMTAVFLANTAVLAFKTAQWLINTGVMLANMAVGILMDAVMLSIAGSASAASVGVGLLTGAMILLVGVAMLVVAGLIAIVAALAIIAGAFLIAVTATQGLGAGFRGLIQLVSGVATGFMFIMSPLLKVVGAIYNFIDSITVAIGMGSAFKVIGIAIGLGLAGIILVVAGLVVALGVLALAWAAMWLAANAPLVLIVAGVALVASALTLALREAINWVVNNVDNIGRAFDDMWDGVKLVTFTVINAITGAFAKMINFLIDGVNKVIAGYNKIPTWAKPGGHIDEFGKMDTGGSFDKELADLEVEINLKVTTRGIQKQMVDAGKMAGKVFQDAFGKEESGNKNWFVDNLKSLGLYDGMKSWTASIGIDIDTASLSDLQNLTTDFMNLQGVSADFDPIDMSLMLQSPEEIKKSVDAWDMYIKEIDSLVSAGYDRQTAEDMAAGKVWQVYGIEPEEVSDQARQIADSIGKGADQITAEQQHFLDEQKKWEDAAKSWYQMDASAMFGTLYDPLAGKGNQSLVSWMSGAGWDAISKNIPEGTATWMNQTEFMADFAIGGGMSFAGEGVYGQNLHKLLKDSGALDALSSQSGIPVEVLLEGVPKFQAPEEFQAVAMVDMVNMIGGLDTTVANWLDTQFGRGVTLASTGVTQDFTDFGMDWAEMNQFAIGKALQGVDWNLADYISESWGISKADAEQYLIDNNIDPNVVTQDMYGKTRDAVLSAGGAYNVLTEEMYQWISDATNGFSTDVIEMTEAEFMAMDDATKAILTRMGYTFVVSDYIPREAYTKATEDFGKLEKSIMDGVRKAEGAGKTWRNLEFPAPDLKMDGIVSDWTFITEFIDEKTGELMVVLQDADGTQVAIPAAEYSEYKTSLDTIISYTTQFKEAFKTAYQDAMNAGKGVPFSIGAGVGAVAGVFSNASEGYGNAALGVPPEIKTKVTLDVQGADEIKKEVDAAIASAGGGPEGTGVQIKFDANLTPLTTKINTYLTGMQGVEGVSIKFDANITPMVTVINTYLTGMQGASGVSIKFNANLTPMTTAIATYLNGMQGATGVAIKFSANLTPMTTAISAYLNGMQGASGVEIKFSANLTPMTTAISTYLDGMQGASGVTIKFNADSKALETVVSTVTGLLQAYATTWKATLSQQNGTAITNTITDINALLTTMANGGASWIARLSQINGSTVNTTITNINTLLTTMANGGSNWIARLSQINGATVNTTITNINALLRTMANNGANWIARLSQTNGATVNSTITGINTLLRTMVNGGANWTARLAQTGGPSVNVTISNLNSLLRTFNSTWTATVKVTGQVTAASVIRNLNNLLDTYDGTRTVYLNVINNGWNTVASAIGQLAGFKSKSITLTTYHDSIMRTAATGGRIGSAGMAGRYGGHMGAGGYTGQYAGIVGRATGGRSRLGELTLVGEQGPELVGLPTSSYVMTARQTERMFRESQAGEGNPLLLVGQSDNSAGNTSVNVEHQGNVVNIYGDMHFGNENSAQQFFDAIDREAGVRLELARRGMRPSSGALD